MGLIMAGVIPFFCLSLSLPLARSRGAGRCGQAREDGFIDAQDSCCDDTGVVIADPDRRPRSSNSGPGNKVSAKYVRSM